MPSMWLQKMSLEAVSMPRAQLLRTGAPPPPRSRGRRAGGLQPWQSAATSAPLGGQLRMLQMAPDVVSVPG
jgi:hypothetical protein